MKSDVRIRGEHVHIQSVSQTNDGYATPVYCGRKMGQKTYGHPDGFQRREGALDMQLYVGRQLLDHVTLKKEY